MNYIRVTSYHANFGNPNVGSGNTDVNLGDGFKTKGIEISSDHQFIFLEPFEGYYGKTFMECEVMFKMTLVKKLANWITRKPLIRLAHKDVKVRTRFRLKDIYSVTFNDGYDDSTYSFHEISADEYVPDNRTRRIFEENQILSPDNLVRGKVIIYHGWHSGLERTIPEKMVILEGPKSDPATEYVHFKGLFLLEEGNWLFSPSLQDTTVSPSANGYYGNHSYLVDTGETLTEDQIIEELYRINPKQLTY